MQNVLLPASFERFAADRATRERAVALLEHFSVPQARKNSTASLVARRAAAGRDRAAALLFDPPVILADEPTASLDAKAGDVVIDILLQRDRRGTDAP